MNIGRSSVAATGWWTGALVLVGRAALLVPEAPILAALVCAFLALGEPPLLGLLSALLIVSFLVRTLALHVARLSLEAGRYNDTRALLQIALALYPWSADALALRGALALVTGDAAAAEVALRRAIALLPGQPTYHAALSSALLALGRPVEAAEAARQALALDETCVTAYIYLAEAERASGVPAHTIEERLRAGLALAEAPEGEAALRCALAEHLLIEERVAEATLTLHGAEALLPRCSAPRQAELRFRLGVMCVAQGQTERAREFFRSVEALDPHGQFAAAAWRASRL